MDHDRAPLTVQTISSHFASWIEDRTTLGRADTTGKRYRTIVDSFLAHLGPQRSGASIASLTASEIEAWRNAELKEGKGKTTADFGVKVLRGALNSAKRKGLILTKPAEAVETTGAAAEVREPFTHSEIAQLLHVANDDWRGMILFDDFPHGGCGNFFRRAESDGRAFERFGAPEVRSPSVGFAAKGDLEASGFDTLLCNANHRWSGTSVAKPPVRPWDR